MPHVPRLLLPSPGRPAAIAVGYALIAAAWIVVSGWLVAVLVGRTGAQAVEVGKGLGFVVATSATLYLLLAAHERAIEAHLTELQQAHRRLELLYRAVEGSRAGVAVLGSPVAGRPVEYANTALSSLLGVPLSQLAGRPAASLAAFQPIAAWLAGEPGAGDAASSAREVEIVRPDGSMLPIALYASRLAEGDEAGHVVVIATDLSAQRRAERERATLARAIDQATEAVVVTDSRGTIEYVNPAFERVSGYSRSELIGQNPRILKSGVQDGDFYRALWGHISQGEPWRGILVNRRRDGSLFEEEATISPVRDATGVVAAYVGVKRDLTAERSLEADLQAEMRDRALVRDAAARIESGVTAEETARSIAAAMRSLRDVEAAFVYHVRPHGWDVVALAADAPSGLEVVPGVSLPPALAAFLRDRLRDSPAGIMRIDLGTFDPRLQLEAAAGYSAVGGGMVYAGEPTAFLVALGRPDDPSKWVGRMETSLLELAAHASPLLGPQLALRDDLAMAHAAIREVLDQGAFDPVFQPIVDLATEKPVGFEALSRFRDGTRPDLRFAEASAVGLGSELQLACARRALAAARDLPAGVWVSFNASPQFVLQGHHAEVIGLGDHPTVLELTEHVIIDDYAALREALSRVEPRIQLAIDDAGAGYSSLRHVLELMPAFIKLDAGLVRGLELDPARQALIAGMVHFAETTGARLIAEGVETRAEAAALRTIGVSLGQGYLFGRPSPAV